MAYSALKVHITCWEAVEALDVESVLAAISFRLALVMGAVLAAI